MGLPAHFPVLPVNEKGSPGGFPHLGIGPYMIHMAVGVDDIFNLYPFILHSPKNLGPFRARVNHNPLPGFRAGSDVAVGGKGSHFQNSKDQYSTLLYDTSLTIDLDI